MFSTGEKFELVLIGAGLTFRYFIIIAASVFIVLPLSIIILPIYALYLADKYVNEYWYADSFGKKNI